MIKQLLIFFFLASWTCSTNAQDPVPEIYSITASAKVQLDNAIKEAEKKNKHVLVFVGGNWCKWCVRLDKFIKESLKIDSLLNSDYIQVHINYSKENNNPEALARLDFPHRFGFPVLVILDEKGKRIHTQNTGYLEDGEGYGEDKILEFLSSWNKKAVDPLNYLIE